MMWPPLKSLRHSCSQLQCSAVSQFDDSTYIFSLCLYLERSYYLINYMEIVTVFSVFRPSLPPTTISLFCKAATPNCSLLAPIRINGVQVFVRGSYISMLLAPWNGKQFDLVVMEVCWERHKRNNFVKYVTQTIQLSKWENLQYKL